IRVDDRIINLDYEVAGDDLVERVLDDRLDDRIRAEIIVRVGYDERQARFLAALQVEIVSEPSCRLIDERQQRAPRVVIPETVGIVDFAADAMRPERNLALQQQMPLRVRGAHCSTVE